MTFEQWQVFAFIALLIGCTPIVRSRLLPGFFMHREMTSKHDQLWRDISGLAGNISYLCVRYAGRLDSRGRQEDLALKIVLERLRDATSTLADKVLMAGLNRPAPWHFGAVKDAHLQMQIHRREVDDLIAEVATHEPALARLYDEFPEAPEG